MLEELEIECSRVLVRNYEHSWTISVYDIFRMSKFRRIWRYWCGQEGLLLLRPILSRTGCHGLRLNVAYYTVIISLNRECRNIHTLVLTYNDETRSALSEQSRNEKTRCIKYIFYKFNSRKRRVMFRRSKFKLWLKFIINLYCRRFRIIVPFVCEAWCRQPARSWHWQCQLAVSFVVVEMRWRRLEV